MKFNYLLCTLGLLTLAGCKDSLDSVQPETSSSSVQSARTAVTGTSDPDNFHGLRTKWLVIEELRTQNGRNSVEPDLAAMSVATWIQKMNEAGSNILEINLENSTAITATQVHSLATLRSWRDSNNGADNLKYFTACGNDQVTPYQWRQLLADFLVKVKATNTPIRFAIHQRIYPDNIGGPKYNVFVNDMSEFINTCKNRGVDNLLLGPRLGEAGFNSNMDLLLEFSYNACKDINAKTGNWLKTKNYMTNGGGRFGANFKGIQNAASRFQTKYGKNFFQAMKEQTGSFAFGYKHFEDGGINAAMQAAGFNVTSTADWKTFITNNLGFSNVRQLIQSNRQAYPNHANLLFFGDSGDSFKLINTPEYNALFDLYKEANVAIGSDGGGGFRGILCVEGVTSNLTSDPDADNFKQAYWVNIANPYTFVSISKKTKSISRWDQWPVTKVF